MLSAIIGGIGNGKTLFLTYKALVHWLEGYNILSNYNLNFPYKPISKLEDIEKILQKGCTDKTLFAFDEGWLFVDSRRPTQKSNLIWSKFFLQTRKLYFDVDITLQHIGQIDTRVRSVLDRVYFPNITKWAGEPRESNPLEMEILCLKRDLLGGVIPYNTLKLNIPADLLNLYNTREIINPVE